MKNFPKQLIPLIVIVVVLIGGLITARHFLVPESFGKYGHYRANSVDENDAQQAVFAGADVCYDCHDDIYDEKEASHHRGVTCEVCHGPALDHAEEPDEILPVIPRGRDFCLLCHGYNLSRPSGFPQIVTERHNPGRSCKTCHSPHDPALTDAPSECAACHRDIANVKVVSHHAALECAECHEVPDGHMSTPRYIRAGKPDSPDVCGVCHERNAQVARELDPPRIDMQEHRGQYQCWDCHYPHFPEARI